MIIQTTNQTVITDLQPYRVEESSVFTAGTFGRKIDGYKLIANEQTHNPICIVSDKYGVIQHDEVMKKTIEDLNNLNVNYDIKKFTINDKSKRNTMATTITFPDITFNIDGSIIEGTMYIHNGTDGITSFTREFGFYRFICQNGLRIPQNLLISERLKHRKNVMITNIAIGIESLTEYVPHFAEILAKAQQIKLNEREIEIMAKHLHLAPRFVKNIVTGDYKEKYVNMVPEQANTDTLWGMYQIMTNYITHEMETRNIHTAQALNERLYNYVAHQVAA